ncbi:MAG: phage major capsid protein [Clostridia bacterium]|nr:phage major capsid protein [Clostridia bacterium]
MPDIKAINELYAKRAQVMNRVRELMKDGSVDPVNQDAFDKANRDFMNLTNRIEQEEKFAVDTAFKDDGPRNPALNERKEAFMNYITRGTISAAVSTATGSMGYTVPEDLRAVIVRKLYDYGDVIGMVDNIDTMTTTDIPVDGTAPTMYWTGEGGAYTDSAPTVSRIQLGAYKGTVLIKASEELLQDSAFDVEKYLTDLSGTALGRGTEAEIVAGTLSGRPTGVLSGAAFALTSSVSSSFTYGDLVDLFTAVKGAYAKNGSFLMARAALGETMKMTDSSGRFVFQPATSVGAPDMLLNRPLKTSENMPGLATTNKGVAFGDFKYYKLGLRGPMSMQRLNELYAANGQIGIRIWQRVDGKLSLSEAVKYMALK